MATYVILSRLAAIAESEPALLKKLAEKVSAKIKEECPDVKWKSSYATFGRFDVVDILESEKPEQVTRAALLIRAYGHAATETMLATPWKDFLSRL